MAYGHNRTSTPGKYYIMEILLGINAYSLRTFKPPSKQILQQQGPAKYKLKQLKFSQYIKQNRETIFWEYIEDTENRVKKISSPPGSF